MKNINKIENINIENDFSNDSANIKPNNNTNSKEPNGFNAYLSSKANNLFILAGGIVIGMMVLSFAVGSNDWTPQDEINYLNNEIKVNAKIIENLKKDWKSMEEIEIKPLIEQAKKIEIKINNLKAERTARIEARSIFFKNKNKCASFKIDFVKRYKTKPTDEVCLEILQEFKVMKRGEVRFSLAKAVAQAEGNGINETNPCNIRDTKTGKFRIYETKQDGIEACHNVLYKYTKVNPNVTLLGAINTFSPVSDGNNPKRHTSNIIYILAKNNIQANFDTKLTKLLEM